MENQGHIINNNPVPTLQSNSKVNPQEVTSPTGPKPTLFKKTATSPIKDSGRVVSGPQNNSMYINEVLPLDPQELNELITLDIHSLTSAKSGKRKMSDEDVYVQETLLFTYNPELTESVSPLLPKKSQTQPAGKSIAQLVQTVDELREKLVVRVEVLKEGDEVDWDDNDPKLLQLMMSSEYPDAEIDKLLETFSMSGQLKGPNKILNGDYIDNDIRLSENIREAIEEIRSIQKVSNTRASEIEKRKYLQKYVEVAELLGVSLTVEHLLPALSELFKQDEGSEKGYIKLIFASLDKLIDFLAASEITVGYNGIRDYITPFFYEFFQSDRVDETMKQDMQGEVIDLLVKVTKSMTQEDRTEKILPIILESIRDDSDEEKRILGLELIERLADLIGKDICQNYLMYEIVSLQDDPIYRVRKETVLKMINISRVLGKDMFLGVLFPVYKKLAHDQIWGVRRAAVEVLPSISNLSPPEIKNGPLIELFKKFANDSSKWVKMATFQFLGPFIASYEGMEPNPLLIDYFINMCEQNKNNQPDNEVPFYCAFNFPAVLLTLGAQSWPKLQPVHQSLVRDSRWKVRRTLSYSLHEIASILGPETTEQELIPILYHFLKDINEVREGVLVNLPKFIKVLTPEQRESYVDKLAQTQIDLQDWRKRVIQSQHIKSFAKLFKPETVNRYYVPIFFQLCQDQVAEVRAEAAKSLKNLIVCLNDHAELFNTFLSQVLLFKQSNRYNLRQTFILMCESLMDNQEVFSQYFLKDFCDLQRDRIINVRMALSEVLANYYKSSKHEAPLFSHPSFQEMLRHLKCDVRDVSNQLTEIAVEEDDDDLTNYVLDTASLIIDRVVDSVGQPTNKAPNKEVESDGDSDE